MIILPKSGGMSNARHMYVRNRGHSDPDGVFSCSRVPTVSLSSTYAHLLCCHGTGWTARDQLLATGAPNPNGSLFLLVPFFRPFYCCYFYLSTPERHFGMTLWRARGDLKTSIPLPRSFLFSLHGSTAVWNISRKSTKIPRSGVMVQMRLG